MRPSDAQTDETIAGLRYELGVLLDAKMGISLSDAGLAAAAAALTRLQVRLGEVPVTDTSLKYNTQWQEYVELTNMLLCAQATIAAAQARRESRGAFQNRDHPATGATAKHSYVRLTQDNLVVRHD
jgi:fumarate reductase flavoprotein subunit